MDEGTLQCQGSEPEQKHLCGGAASVPEQEQPKGVRKAHGR